MIKSQKNYKMIKLIKKTQKVIKKIIKKGLFQLKVKKLLKIKLKIKK